MKLAYEHDKEFKEKYSIDLDTSLIFVRVTGIWNSMDHEVILIHHRPVSFQLSVPHLSSKFNHN